MEWGDYFTEPSDVSLALISTYSIELVALSFLISIVCSTVAFYIVEIARKSVDATTKKVAILSGAITLGCSVWSMHFIGMLALRICAPVRYDMTITLLSIVPSMLASFLAFNLFVNKEATPYRLAISGALVGAGIGVMHYTGMQAMVMAPYLRYQPLWFMLSVFVAVALAIVSLKIASSNFNQKVRAWQRIIICGTVLGCAVCFMHYLGMKAAVFIGPPVTATPVAADGMGTMVLAITFGMMFICINGVGLNLFKYREMANAARRESNAQLALIKKLKETQQQLLQSEKMASVGQLASGIAHEINNPIGFVNSNICSLQNYVGVLLDAIDKYEKFYAQLSLSGERLEALNKIGKSADLKFITEDISNLLKESLDGLKRVKDIVQSLKDFAHAGADEWMESDIHQGIDSTLNIVRNEIKYKVTIEKNYGILPPVNCIISQVNQVFMNLFINASQAIKERGIISISTGIEKKEDVEWVWIKVADTGSGISAENLNRIFDPFFTTKPIGSGTGLGLSLAYGIISNHNGYIDVESEVGKGTSFTIHLPVKGKIRKEEAAPESERSVEMV